MAPRSVVPSTSAVPTEASDSEHMNSGDESTQEYLPETTDTGGDSDADDIESDGETVTTVPGECKAPFTPKAFQGGACHPDEW